MVPFSSIARLMLRWTTRKSGGIFSFPEARLRFPSRPGQTGLFSTSERSGGRTIFFLTELTFSRRRNCEALPHTVLPRIASAAGTRTRKSGTRLSRKTAAVCAAWIWIRRGGRPVRHHRSERKMTEPSEAGGERPRCAAKRNPSAGFLFFCPKKSLFCHFSVYFTAVK